MRTLKTHKPLLEFLRSTVPPQQKKAVLRLLTTAQVTCISELVLNLLHGVIPLTPGQKTQFAKYKKILRILASKGSSRQRKIKLLTGHLNLVEKIIILIHNLLQ
jgi:hypothetical protein